MNAEQAILNELREMREELQHVARRTLAAPDRRDLATLLPAMPCSASRHGPLPACAALNATSSALQALLADYATESGGLRSFGRFLERCNGIACAGRRLVAVGDDRAGAPDVVRLSGPSKPAPSLAPQCLNADDSAP